MKNAQRSALLALAAVSAALGAAANPLNFAEYEQTVTATFATPAAAEAATLRAADLPEGCSRVFTSRWDDANPAHVAKAEMLTANGIRANFYLNDGDGDYLRTVAPKLLALGHALGNHTVGHPDMMDIPANAAWAEILREKIAIETRLSTPCVAYAAPFGWTKTIDADRAPLVVRMLQASGHYVCDDAPVCRPGWDCAADAWFETVRFGADDRQPSRAAYDREFAAAERRLAQRPEIGRLTFGVHSWCDAAGTKLQGELLAETRRAHPDWYFCHANAFGAYRYSARFGRVRKVGTDGVRATWRVTRFDPVDLGDGIPLSLVFSEPPAACPLTRGRNGTYALAHARPTSFVAADAAELDLVLTPDAQKGTLAVRLTNKTGEPLTGVRLTACLPPRWQVQRQVAEIGAVAPNAAVVHRFGLGELREAASEGGAALYAACADFRRGDRRLRAWGTATEAGAPAAKGTPRDSCLVMGPFDERKFDEAAWLAASQPGAELPDVGTAKNERWISLVDPARLPTSVYVNMPYGPLVDRDYRAASGPFVGTRGARLFAVEFVAPDDGDGELFASFDPKFRSPVVYLNGSRQPFTGSPMRLAVRRGVNRLVVRADLAQDRHLSSEQLTVCRGGFGHPFAFQRVREPTKPAASVSDWLEIRPAESMRIGKRPFNVEVFTDRWRTGSRRGAGVTMAAEGWPRPRADGGFDFKGTWKVGTNVWALAERLVVRDARQATYALEVRPPTPADIDCFWLKGIFSKNDWRKEGATFDGKRVDLKDGRRVVLPDVKAISLPAAGGRVTLRGAFSVGIEDISQTSYAPDSLCVQIMPRTSGGKALDRIGLAFDLAYAAEAGTPLDLRAALNFGFADEVAGDGKGGWSDQGAENDLRQLPTGRLTCDNVSFEVVNPAANGGKGCLTLGGAQSPKLPRRATVRFAEPAEGRWLNLLHAVAFPVRDGKPTGFVTVTYADGGEQRLPVVCGVHVGNFWNPADPREAAVGWIGRNASAQVGLYVTRFRLDRSGVVSLAFDSRADGATWMVVAATVTAERVPGAQKRKAVVRAGTDWRAVSGETAVRPGSILDFSFLLDAPAGRHGRVVPDAAGRLVFEKTGRRLRLYGANLCFDANYLPDRQAIDRLADNFARIGYNFVRFHHFDGGLLKRGGAYMELDPDRLDRLDYTLAAMKRRGVYATLDLFINRDANLWPVRGFEGQRVDRGSHKALIWGDEGFRRQFLDFARQLMTHRNPYTGLTWGEDPAIVNVDCVNEDAVSWTVNGQFSQPVFTRHFEAWLSRNAIPAAERATDRARLWNAFLCDFYPDSFRKTEAELRAMGVRHLLTDQNHGHSLVGIVTREPYGLVENHFYHAHPRSIKGSWGLPAACDPGSSKATLERDLMGMALTRRLGVPFLVTEWDYVSPNPYAAEGALMCASYAALQDWDGLNRFAWDHRAAPLLKGGGVPEWFNISNDPLRQLSERIAACLFTRGDVKPSDVTVPVLVSRRHFREKGARDAIELLGTRLGLVARTGNVLFTPGERLALPADVKAVLTVDRAGEEAAEAAGLMHLDSNAHREGFGLFARRGILRADAEDAARRLYRSSTGELELGGRDLAFKAVTPKSEAFALEPGARGEGRFASVRVNGSFGVVCVAAMDGEELARSSRYLVLHLTRLLATDMTFADEEMTVQETFGKLPLLLRRGTASLRLARDLAGFSLYALRNDGTRLRALPATVAADGTATLALSTDEAMAYELVRE